MSTLQDFFQQLSRLQPTTLAAVTALAGATGAVIVGVITGVVTKFVVSARDRQDKEAEWRKHAIELTKLDLDRKLKTRSPSDTRPVRPSILDFLANYRDLQDLDKASPRDLYVTIQTMRTKKQGTSVSETPSNPGKEPPRTSEYED
ncbi:hypothetical protein [Mesorhizobium sp. M4B.F.Ca.ET.017.02.2.1]|uniref:hypothetical protein n=1 Tax=Mesorhizobium sp. M4B.F.Ca.ET.017.02.2.1 TaxID=2496649 RepID=UPI000FCBC52D|nr:hypothetical protein [Mesorhizobium sp. M4B.F.Ca.ET.017.02.2.1]RVD31771.1 hypothetical protein EN738_00145 [Mesorhizobium sp. M4B.F.Ca.ET.017.02.2.1]